MNARRWTHVVVLFTVLAWTAACGDEADPGRSVPGEEAAPAPAEEAGPAATEPPGGGPDTTGAGPAADSVVAPETEPATGDSASPPPTGSGLAGYDTVFVYFTGPITDDDLYGPLVAVPRAVPDTADALAYAVREQLAGPTAADVEANGPLYSWFSDNTAGMLRGVGLENGLAVLDFEDFRAIITGASTSAGAIALLRELTAVAFQFPQARRLELRIDGSCGAIMDWLQYGCIQLGRSSYTDFEGHRLAVPAGGAPATAAAEPGGGDTPPSPTGSGLTGYDTVFTYFTGPIPPPEIHGPLLALPRAVPDAADPLAFALLELLAGPKAADDAYASEFNTWFSEETAGMLRGVSLEDGLAIIDFEDFRSIIPGASSSAGGAMFTRQVLATVYQFPEVQRIELRIDGDCDAIMGWLQIGCMQFRRASYSEPRGHRMAVVAVQSAATADAEDWLTYEGTGYTIRYPPGFAVTRPHGVLFTPPDAPRGCGSRCPVFLHIVREGVPAGTTLEAFAHAKAEAIGLSPPIEEFRVPTEEAINGVECFQRVELPGGGAAFMLHTWANAVGITYFYMAGGGTGLRVQRAALGRACPETVDPVVLRMLGSVRFDGDRRDGGDR